MLFILEELFSQRLAGVTKSVFFYLGSPEPWGRRLFNNLALNCLQLGPLVLNLTEIFIPPLPQSFAFFSFIQKPSAGGHGST
mgnify:CR=1 FL=1